jgi:Asp-tRNA(Asn)/Glu-tRNA(Gln) amidotransferase A subunit family amidase
MKPRHNAISPDDRTTFSFSFDTIGVSARSVEGLQLVASIYSIKDDDPPNDIPLKEVSVALVKTPFWSKAGQGTMATMERATTILRSHGVKVEEVSLPSGIDEEESLARCRK